MSVIHKVKTTEFNKGLFIHKKRVLCRISNRNIVAFVVLCHIDDGNNQNSHVYVSDIATPWQHHKVMSSKTFMSTLEWSPCGEYLVFGYNNGDIEVWAAKERALNAWTLCYKASLPHESILGVKFFHTGKAVRYNTQKRETLHAYADKLERLDYKPTLYGRGCTATLGFVAITSSCMLAAIEIPKLMPPNGTVVELKPSTEIIGSPRIHTAHCSVAHAPSGALHMALNHSEQPERIRCLTVSLKLDTNSNINVKSEALPSFVLNSMKGKEITQLAYARFGVEEVVLVAYKLSSSNCALLEQWNLLRRQEEVHPLLTKNKGELWEHEEWQQVAQLSLPGVVINEICLPRLHSDQPAQFALVLDDYSVRFVQPGLQQVSELRLPPHCRDGNQPDTCYISADLTPSGQMLIVFDNYAQQYTMQTPQLIGDAVGMLEYCLTTGCDCTDVLMLNLGNMDTIMQLLTENFARQPGYARQYYYSRILALKSNIYRIQTRRRDYDDHIVLHALTILFKSLIRPSDLGCQDKSPVENLAKILAEYMPDVETVILNLDAKDFSLEPLTLQSLQHLIQWVFDLSLHLLERLMDEAMKFKLLSKQLQQQPPSPQHYNLCRDMLTINHLRELLVIIRIWSHTQPNCLPTYTRLVDNFDVLEVLFRTLTRLAQNQAEPDDAVLDECVNLGTQLAMPQRYVFMPTTLLSMQLLNAPSTPLLFTSGREPSLLQEPRRASVQFPPCVTDGVSNLLLGSKVGPVRRCNRCGFINTANKTAKSAALKAWYNKWTFCYCASFWVIADC